MKALCKPLIVALFLAGVVGWGFLFFTGEAVPHADLERIKKGMTFLEVRRILGEPDVIGGDSFNYGGPTRGVFCTVHVLFNENGRVQGIFHDH